MAEVKAPTVTPEDRRAAGLILRLATLAPDEAQAMLLPLCSAARVWAEEQIKKGS